LKSLIALLNVLLIELGARCGTSTARDIKTIRERCEHEGLSFLTITLPAFGKDFEKSLDQGRVDSSLFLGFSRREGLPRFLGGFLSRVFASSSGLLLDDPDIDAIRAIRQVTLMFGKIKLPCSPERTQLAFRKYLECEQDVRLADQLLLSEPNRVQEFRRIGRLLWADLFAEMDNTIYHELIVPRHGPGATADKLRGNAKYNNRRWTRRLDEVFPHWENLIPSESLLQRMDGVTVLEPGEEVPVKVTPVPKTLKTPRLIAEEPTCMQYMQQGILALVVKQIARSDNARNFICFKSQEPNQRLALEGSLRGSLATLDLSEASDRVSNQHVRLLLLNHPNLSRAVDATRSRKADVLGQTIRLAKFASMGSALCFPMEAFVFATVVFLGIQEALSRPLTTEDIKRLRGSVRVYGDDIIVPTDYVHCVVRELEAFGFRVNTAKSFWTGRFRESCGKEYYAGQDVCLARVRQLLPTSQQQVSEVAATVAFRNQLFELGYSDTVDYLDSLIERVIPFPWVERTSSLLGRYGHYLPSQETRHDPDLQHPLVRGAVISAKSPKSYLDDYGALMKWFLNEGEDPLQKDHLIRAGRPESASIKIRWTRPY